MDIGDAMTKTNFDQVSDDPVAAFNELAGNVDTFNAFRALLQTVATLLIGDGLQNNAGTLDFNFATNASLEINAGGIRVKVSAGIKRTASGLALNIEGLSAIDEVDIQNDRIVVLDADATGVKEKTALISELNLGGGTKIYVSDGQFIVPANTFRIEFIITGGGGGGGAGGNGGAEGGGGASGGSTFHGFLSVNPGDVIQIDVGAPGLGATVLDTSGQNGGTTTLTINSQIVATVPGGLGGSAGFSGGGAPGAEPGSGSTTGEELFSLTGFAGLPREGNKGGNSGGNGLRRLFDKDSGIAAAGVDNQNGGDGPKHGDGGAGGADFGLLGGDGKGGLVILKF